MEQAWTVPDVHLLTDGGEGQIAVPHLTLTFAPTGMELDKADGEEVWSSTWTQLQELSPVERSVLPDGRDGVVILVVEREDRRRHRFVLPTDDVASTEATIRRRAVGARAAERGRPGLRCSRTVDRPRSCWQRPR